MKFLVAVDGSENSLRAVNYAAFMLEHFPESTVTIVYVDTLSAVLKKKGAEFPSNFDEVRNNAINKALGQAEKAFADRKLPCKVKILEGYDVAETISDYAKENKYNQIIVGTRGLGNIRGIVMGSVSHKLIHLAPCPVTLVK